MAELKTKVNDASVQAFLESVEDERKRADSLEILELMKEISGEDPKMWGPSIIGFGTYLLKYKTGREAEWFLTGFSPRKQSITLYIMNGFRRYDELLSKLGKHSTGKACLYIKRLEDIDKTVLRALVQESVEYMREVDNKNRQA